MDSTASATRTKLLVCATQRSGSTLACEDLSNAGLLGKPNEWFIPWNPKTRKDWASELEVVKEKGTTANGVFSAKLMANQIRAVDTCLSTFVEPTASEPFPHLRTLFNNALWVWVRRRNTIDQAISHYLAKTSGVYHVVNVPKGFVPGSSITAMKAEEKLSEVPYDFQSIMQEWYVIQRDNLIWESFFGEAGISPFVVWYEQYPDNLAKLVATEMGIEANIAPPQRNLVKMPSQRNEEIRRRFVSDLLARA